MLVLVGCARDGRSPPDSASGSAAAAATSASRVESSRVDSTRAPAVTCVSEGAWQPCSLERRLTDAGFVLINKGPSPVGVFPVSGTTYMLGPAELHVYLFASAKARETAISGIDTVAIAPRGGVGPWPAPPSLITSNNLVAVLISDNGRLIERVQNAITAGLPAPVR